MVKKTVKKKLKKEVVVPQKIEIVEDVKEIKNIVEDEDDFVFKTPEKSDRYYEATGKRKTAIARVRLSTEGEKTIIVNEKPFDKYFSTKEMQDIAFSPLEKMKAVGHFRVTVLASGGGIHAQAEAVRHGISRTLVKYNADFRKRLRRAGFLTRDPRARERKKFGLKRARRGPQWSKR
jgi:small subunit ribosomal protein S9